MSVSVDAARRARGFTLIELLVVLALIALLTGLAALSVGIVGSPGEREARRLASTLRLAMDESRLQSRVLGLRIDDQGYSYLELLPGELEGEPGFNFAWKLVGRRGALAPRSWPQAMRFELRINGRLVTVASRGTSRAPQIVLLPEGEFTPFSLRLVETREAGVEMRFSASGQLDLQFP